jgi:hypothetical protein
VGKYRDDESFVRVSRVIEYSPGRSLLIPSRVTPGAKKKKEEQIREAFEQLVITRTVLGIALNIPPVFVEI